jgi:hypothetical protein
MSCQPAEQPPYRAETRKVISTTERELEKSISGQEEEGHTPTVEGELPRRSRRPRSRTRSSSEELRAATKVIMEKMIRKSRR